MPTLRNPRRERFAQLLASGKTATDAYELAGYKRNDSNAPNLARTDEINGRVTEINNETLERERTTAAVAAERAEMARAACEGAMEAGQFSAAVAATKEIGVLTGIRIERSERGMPGEFDWVDKLSVDELRLLAAGKLDNGRYRQADAASSRRH
jgi:phage terminase small subunit